MSGIFSRSLYDECNNRETLDISVAPGVWVHNTIQQNPEACFPKNGPRNTRLMNSSELNARYENVIDIENSLYGIDIPLSRCMNQRTLIDRDIKLNNLYQSNKKFQEPKMCNDFLDDKYTRLDEPGHITEKPFPINQYPIIEPKNWVYYGTDEESTYGNKRDGLQTRYDTKMSLEDLNKKMRKEAGILTTITGSNY